MQPDPKLLVAAAASLVAHVALAHGLAQLPRQPDPMPEERVEIRVEERPPAEPAKEPEAEPPKAPPPEPKQQEPKPVVHERPRAVAPAVQAEVPHDTPPAEHAPVASETTDTPVFGVNMESTSSAGGTEVPVGNTLHGQPGVAVAPTSVKPLAAPVAAYEATKMPLPQGQCFGKYTEEARAAGDEGTVVLDLTVGDDGRAREIDVVTGLPHGLTEAAIAALHACRFSPGEKDGHPVAVRIRGFKIRFVLANAE
jgi:protein TonB